MAATTTTVMGLKKALRLVKITTRASAMHNRPEAITVQRRALGWASGTVPFLTLYKDRGEKSKAEGRQQGFLLA